MEKENKIYFNDFKKLPKTCLRSVHLHYPKAHRFWDDYQVAIVHLKDMPGEKPAKKNFDDCTHELMILALERGKEIDLEKGTCYHLLPPNLAYQFRNLSDEQAKKIFSKFLERLKEGNLNPDSDFRVTNETILNALTKEVV